MKKEKMTSKFKETVSFLNNLFGMIHYIVYLTLILFGMSADFETLTFSIIKAIIQSIISFGI